MKNLASDPALSHPQTHPQHFAIFASPSHVAPAACRKGDGFQGCEDGGTPGGLVVLRWRPRRLAKTQQKWWEIWEKATVKETYHIFSSDFHEKSINLKPCPSSIALGATYSNRDIPWRPWQCTPRSLNIWLCTSQNCCKWRPMASGVRQVLPWSCCPKRNSRLNAQLLVDIHPEGLVQHLAWPGHICEKTNPVAPVICNYQPSWYPVARLFYMGHTPLSPFQCGCRCQKIKTPQLLIIWRTITFQFYAHLLLYQLLYLKQAWRNCVELLLDRCCIIVSVGFIFPDLTHDRNHSIPIPVSIAWNPPVHISILGVCILYFDPIFVRPPHNL